MKNVLKFFSEKRGRKERKRNILKKWWVGWNEFIKTASFFRKRFLILKFECIQNIKCFSCFLQHKEITCVMMPFCDYQKNQYFLDEMKQETASVCVAKYIVLVKIIFIDVGLNEILCIYEKEHTSSPGVLPTGITRSSSKSKLQALLQLNLFCHMTHGANL